MSTEFSERPPCKHRKPFYTKALGLIYVPFDDVTDGRAKAWARSRRTLPRSPPPLSSIA